MTLFLRLLSLLPLSCAHALGAAAGWLIYALSPTYRRHLRQNLAIAGYDEAALRREAVAQAGRMLAELPRVWLRPRGEAGELVVRVSGWQLVESAWDRGEGIIFLTPHLGCFEITARYYALFAPITVLYRPPKQTWLRPVIESGRGGDNLHLAPADIGGVRSLMRALKRREAIGMLPDQVPGHGEGAWTDFFGRPAYTMTLAARLTQGGAARVLFAYAERLPGGQGYHLRLMPPDGEIAGSVAERAAAINRGIESVIRRCPAQYLWGYNRYKVPAGAIPPAQQGAVRSSGEGAAA